MNSVFILNHISKSGDIKFLGIFSSREKAINEVSNYINLPGFKDCRNGFFVGEYCINKTTWNEGYISQERMPDNLGEQVIVARMTSPSPRKKK